MQSAIQLCTIINSPAVDRSSPGTRKNKNRKLTSPTLLRTEENVIRRFKGLTVQINKKKSF